MLRRPERTTSWSSAMRILVIGFSLAPIVEQLLHHWHRWKPGFGRTVNADIATLVHRIWSRSQAPAGVAFNRRIWATTGAGLSPRARRRGRACLESWFGS